MTNKFVSFLKKAGQVLATGAEIAIKEIPALQGLVSLLPASAQGTAGSVLTTANNDASWLLAAVTSAETAGNVIGTPGLSGAQKAAMAGALIAPAFLNAMSVAGKTPQNPVAANAALVAMAGNLADFMNAYDGSALPSPTGTAIAPTTPAPAAPAAPTS
jgi:hypothetical protein